MKVITWNIRKAKESSLVSRNEFVQQELDFFKGNFIPVQLKMPDHQLINVISVYSPPWTIHPSRYEGVNTSEIKLSLNKRMWAFDIIHTWLNNQDKDAKGIHQLDHMYTSSNLIENLIHCKTEEPDLIFGNKLSDHLPIISTFH